MLKKWHFPVHPAANGLAERNVQTPKRKLIAMNNEKINMSQKIREIVYRYRATPLSSGKSAAELYLHRQIRIKLDAIFPPKMEYQVKQHLKVRKLSVGVQFK